MYAARGNDNFNDIFELCFGGSQNWMSRSRKPSLKHNFQRLPDPSHRAIIQPIIQIAFTLNFAASYSYSQHLKFFFFTLNFHCHHQGVR